MPPSHTYEGLVAALAIRTEHPEIGVLVLSQYIETHYADARCLGHRPKGAGYLLKDRVTQLSEFTEAVTRVATGGSAIDPSVVAELLGRRRTSSPIEEQLTDRERTSWRSMAEGRSIKRSDEQVFMRAERPSRHT